MGLLFEKPSTRTRVSFEAGMINNALHLVQKGLLTPPLHFDFVLGAPGAEHALRATLLVLLQTGLARFT